jgi:uncharacterized membrane protein YedE/YeeE
MVMTAPFEINETLSLGTAVLLGLVFGVALERGGLADPHRLTGAFFFRDFTMPKVMFTAIIVASAGLYALSDLHLLDLGRVWIIPAFFWPQLAGGAIFGVGYVLSGYCPGTSAAGLASGRIDALVAMIGIVTGSLLFAFLYPALEGFYLSSDMGAMTLQKLLGTGHWAVIICLAAAAVALFAALGRMERRA